MSSIHPPSRNYRFSFQQGPSVYLWMKRYIPVTTTTERGHSRTHSDTYRFLLRLRREHCPPDVATPLRSEINRRHTNTHRAIEAKGGVEDHLLLRRRTDGRGTHVSHSRVCERATMNGWIDGRGRVGVRPSLRRGSRRKSASRCA
eukprot:GHVU01013531.1.p1 GENE.GHVU01013531.1~~GHVU01013531.1.p1  ORF type:complete len:145 (-),score=6.23 GHVU01013531.1:97-531(-)